MACKMSDFHGIDSDHITKLRVAGIEDTDDLMKLWNDKGGRAGMVASTGIAEGDFMRFAAMARLSRVKGMALEHLDALIAAGIDGPKRLFTHTPETLAKHLAETAGEKEPSRPLPTLEEITPWFAHPKPSGETPGSKNEANRTSGSGTSR
jgi:hypothetical protein